MSNSPMPPAMAASIAYQKEHLDDSRVSVLLGTVWALWSLAAVAVGLRIYAERTMGNRWRWHDTLIVVGLVFTAGKAIVNTIGAHHGLGRHIILASQSDLIIIYKLYYTFNYVYTTAITAVKASVLCFYHRTFPNRAFRAAVWAMSVFVALWYIVNLVATTFQCTPIDKAWIKTQPGNCINMSSMLVILGIINALTDVVIIVMPLPLIWRLNLPTGRRYGLICIFALSSIVIVACIARPIYLSFPSSYDFTYDSVDTNLWCLVEPSIAIVGACLPLMAPLFRKAALLGSEFTSSLAKYSTNSTDQSFTKDKQSQDSQTTTTSQSSTAWPKGIEISTAISFDVSNPLEKSRPQVALPARTLTSTKPESNSDSPQTNRISGPTYPSLPQYLLPAACASPPSSPPKHRSNPSPTTAHRSLEISSPSSPSHRQEQFVNEFTLISPPYNPSSVPDHSIRRSPEVPTSRQMGVHPSHEQRESLKRAVSASVRKATTAGDGQGVLLPTSRYSRPDNTKSGTTGGRTMSLTSTKEESTYSDRSMTMPATMPTTMPAMSASALPSLSAHGEPDPGVALMDHGRLLQLDETDTHGGLDDKRTEQGTSRGNVPKKAGQSFYLHP